MKVLGSPPIDAGRAVVNGTHYDLQLTNCHGNLANATKLVVRTQTCAVMINKARDFHSERLPFGVIEDNRFGLLAIKGGFAGVRCLEMVVVWLGERAYRR